MTPAAPGSGEPALKDHLDACVRAAAELRRSLLDERSALVTRDPQQLESAVSEKTDRLRRFAELLEQHGGQDLAAVDDSLWQQFSALTAECEALNSANGAAIRLRRRQVEHGIALLRGGEQPASIYGPRGTADGASNSRPLLEA